ncbi:MAG: hypothetical protein IT340_23730 [Chloroflexi bacterium]|nr:hypothetical protein [Chloroflexota bacterium]
MEVSIKVDQLRCRCVNREAITLPDGTIVEHCTDYEWRSEAITQPIPSTATALDEVKLYRYQTNAQYGRICPAPWFGARGHDDQYPDPSQPRQADEEYSVNLAFWWRGALRLEDRLPVCAPSDPGLIKTVINAPNGANHAVRYEDGFDIEAAVNAAVAALPFEQLQLGANPPGAPDGIRLDHRGLVGLPVYFWFEGDEAAPFGGVLVAAPGNRGRTIRAWVVLHPAETTWRFGDGAPSLATTSRGVPWPEAEPAGPAGLPDPKAIAHTFELDGRFQVTARSRWVGRWGLYEEFGTSCFPGVPCPRHIPIYSTTPVVVDHIRPYEVMEVRSVRTG